MSIRPVRKISQPLLAREGAGVRLRRAFGFGDPLEVDPFPLLDDFRSDNPDDDRAGFPWHPHRGIETITYVLAGAVEHGIRFLLVSGRPIEEPIAWSGPIVMNTEAELRQAWKQLEEGTFIKHR